MLDSKLGLPDRYCEQLFKVGPGNRCFTVAGKTKDWFKMEIARLSMQLHSIPRDNFTFPKNTEGALFTTQPFMTPKFAKQQTAPQNNMRHSTTQNTSLTQNKTS